MDKIQKNVNKEKMNGEDLGLILWELESLENFYPCYRTMIKKE
jgi:hypothetical protein